MCSIPRKYWQQKIRLPGIVLLRAQGSRFSVVRPFHKVNRGISLNHMKINGVIKILKKLYTVEGNMAFPSAEPLGNAIF